MSNIAIGILIGTACFIECLGEELGCISHGITNMLPIFLVYEKEWYYKSITPIFVGLIPVVIYGIYGFLRMKKTGLIVKK